MKLRHLNFEIGDLNFGIDFNFRNWEFWKKNLFILVQEIWKINK